MSGRVVTSALVALGVGVGVIVGLAAPQDDAGAGTGQQPEATAGDEAQRAELATRDAWVAALADAETDGRVQGLRVALVVTDGATPEAVADVTDALTRGGATIETTATMSADWWEPALASFRGELAAQVAGSVVGTEGLGATDVLEHAIVQAIVTGAVPDAPTPADGTPPADAVAAADRQAVLLEILERAEILASEGPATEGVDALVVVTGEGPDGAADVLAATARVWEGYVGTTLIVAADPEGDSPIATDLLAAVADADDATRPSVVIASVKSLAAAQVVAALVEQVRGGSGAYGNRSGLDLIATQ